MYASFQHDRSAPAALWAMGWQNVCWGSDYPHLEGTFGHTQETLHALLDDVDDVDTRAHLQSARSPSCSRTSRLRP